MTPELELQLKKLRNYLAGTFYQSREGGLQGSYTEIIKDWNHLDRSNFCDCANYVLEHGEHKDLTQQISLWLFWVIDDPVGWLKHLIELAQTGKLPIELED